jgi:hypothetical protein
VAYVLTNVGVEQVDVHDPSHPTLLTRVAWRGIQGLLFVTDKLLFSTGYNSGVQFYATGQQYVPQSLTVRGATRLDSADGAVQLVFGGGELLDGSNVTQMDRLTTRQAATTPRAIERSFLIEARTTTGSSIGQATQPYTVELVLPRTTQSAEERRGLAYWDGATWVDLPPCAQCAAEPGKLIAQTDRFGELAVVLDAPLPFTPLPATPTPPKDTPPTSQLRRLFLPVLQR